MLTQLKNYRNFLILIVLMIACFLTVFHNLKLVKKGFGFYGFNVHGRTQQQAGILALAAESPNPAVRSTIHLQLFIAQAFDQKQLFNCNFKTLPVMDGKGFAYPGINIISDYQHCQLTERQASLLKDKAQQIEKTGQSHYYFIFDQKTAAYEVYLIPKNDFIFVPNVNGVRK